MERKKLVISGGNSFIARHLLQKLDRNKYEIIALVRNDPEKKFRVNGVKYLVVDMEEYHELDQYIDVCDYYLAFAWNGTKREDRNNIEINEKSYHCILNSIKVLAEKCGCSKVLIPGTFSEYRNTHTTINEKTCCEPVTAYGKFKYQLYKDASAACQEYGVSLIETRLFSVYGSDDSEDKMINSILKKMLNNETIFLTKAEQIWDFIHVDDVVEALCGLLESDVESGCYNIATMEHRTLRSYLEEMKNITGSESDLVYGAIPYEGEQVPHTICDTTKIMHSINWEPGISFEEGIKKWISNYK